jgi:4'-phosphopantetheinyl transferase
VDVERTAPALAELERDTPRLTAQDRRRALAIKDPNEQQQRLAVYTALRVLLERMAGARAGRQPFIRSASGKPRLAASSVKFSLSHIEGYALIGLTRSGEIGVDLERERPLRISPRRRDELIAVAEGLAGRHLSGRSEVARFLQAWSRLEAFAKAQGQGIGSTLADLGLRSGRARSLTELEAAATCCARDAGLTVRDIPLDPGLYAAAALEKAGRLQPAWLPADRAGLERLLSPSTSRPRGG